MPSSRHVIRLHGPWIEVEPQMGRRWRVPLALSTVLEAASNEGIPRVLLRRFGSPTGLSPHSKVLLVWQPSAFPITLTLNGSSTWSIPPDAGHAADVTTVLRTRNELRAEATDLAMPDHPDDAWWIRSVTLEIEEG